MWTSTGTNRSSKSGGGVGLYVSNNLNFKIRDDISGLNDGVMETLFIEIIRPHGKNFIIGVIYRPPSQNVSKGYF